MAGQLEIRTIFNKGQIWNLNWGNYVYVSFKTDKSAKCDAILLYVT